MFTCIKERLTNVFYLADRHNGDAMETEFHLLLKSFPSKREDWNETHYFYFKMMYTHILYVRDIHCCGEYDACYRMIFVLYEYFPELALAIIDLLVFSETNGGEKIYNTTSRVVNIQPPKYGCWKDMKNICELVYNRVKQSKHPIIEYIIQKINQQLYSDIQTLKTNTFPNSYLSSSSSPLISKTNVYYPISNVAKWIPREKSRLGWLFDCLAFHWETTYFPTTWRRDKNAEKWENGARMKYRKHLSLICREALNITEVSMCNKWSEIKVENIPLHTLQHNRNVFTQSFENKTYDKKKTALGCMEHWNRHYMDVVQYKKGIYSPYHSPNRKEYVLLETPTGSSENSLDGLNELNELNRLEGDDVMDEQNALFQKVGGLGKNRELGFFIKEAVKCLRMDKERLQGILKYNTSPKTDKVDMKKYCDVKNRIELLNKQWNYLCCHYSPFVNVLPILDLSWSMWEEGGDAWYEAVGWACFVASKSSLGNRILTVDYQPSWIVFDEDDELTKKVEKILLHCQGNTHASIDKTIYMLAQSFHETNTPCEETGKIICVLFSDMVGWKNDEIKDIHLAGHIQSVYNHYFHSKRISGKRLPLLPHFVFWKLGGRVGAYKSPLSFPFLPSNYSDKRITWMKGSHSGQSHIFYNLNKREEYLASSPLQTICGLLMDERYSIIEPIIAGWKEQY